SHEQEANKGWLQTQSIETCRLRQDGSQGSKRKWQVKLIAGTASLCGGDYAEVWLHVKKIDGIAAEESGRRGGKVLWPRQGWASSLPFLPPSPPWITCPEI